MNSARRTSFSLFALLPVAVLVLAASTAAQASTITIDMVTVGNPGNAMDVEYGSNPAAGAVGYTYNMGTYPVTNQQYAAFLNAVATLGDPHGLYNANMTSNDRGGINRAGTGTLGDPYVYSAKTNFGNKPVNYVSFWDAARFTNWLHNGQSTGAPGLGTTEGGAYLLNGVTSPTNNTISRQAGAQFYLPSEDEWYKAAYYDPTLNSGSGGYYLYATQSNTAPTVATADSTGDIDNPGSNVANYNSEASWNSVTGNVTTVGSAEAPSYYGTFDQAGNVWDWNEAIIGSTDALRGLRGGSWFDNAVGLAASFRGNGSPANESSNFGFRVASPFSETVFIPEPSSWVLGLIGLSGLLWWRRRFLKTSL